MSSPTPERVPPAGSAVAPDDEADPQVPALRSWRGVYTFVLGCLGAYIALLATLGWYFSR